MTCKLCENTKIVAKGLCSKHYDQQRYQLMREQSCIVDGCDTRRNSTTGYCGFHYTSLRVLNDPLARGNPGEFCRHGHYNDWRITKSGQKRCNACDKAHDMKRNQTEKRKRYSKNLKLIKTYGITLEELEQKFVEQNYKCKICQDDLKEGKGGYSVDHDHVTGRVRGLLCRPCNKGLGHFRDDIQIMKLALDYLKYYEEPN